MRKCQMNIFGVCNLNVSGLSEGKLKGEFFKDICKIFFEAVPPYTEKNVWFGQKISLLSKPNIFLTA